MKPTNLVQEHYGFREMPARVENALRQAGYGEGPINWSELAALDQFHTRGLAATKEMAEGVGLTEGDSILDVGSGLGGPTRYLAAVHGCHVTGIELTPLYVEIAALLSRRTGLADRTRFVQGDALEMPFESESFDHAWTQHVAMNIPDKGRLYRAVHRVLKKGGRLALYDIVAGGGGPPHFPVPWARTPDTSFLVTMEGIREALAGAGFAEVGWEDTTAKALSWLTAQRNSPAPPSADALSLALVMGPEFGAMAANLGRNLMEGRVRVLQGVVERT